MHIPKEKLLLIGMNSTLLGSMKDFLSSRFQIETASNPQMADFLIQEWEPKVCLVEDSNEMIAWIPKLRSQKNLAKIGVIVFATGSQHNEEKAFKQGCDHWLHIEGPNEKIVWRIQSLVRSTHMQGSAPAQLRSVPSTQEEPSMQVDQLKIYPKDFLVKRMGNVVSISPTQFKLLSAFVSHPDQLLSRDWIKTHVWNNSEISLRSIDAHISKLRKALPELDQYLMNIYGKGYIFSRSKQEAA